MTTSRLRNIFAQGGDLLWTILPLLALLGMLLISVYYWLSPRPPMQLRFATGQANGTYIELAHQYVTDIQEHYPGLKVELIETKGATDNIQRLRMARSAASSAEVAFAQNGGVDARIGLDPAKSDPNDPMPEDIDSLGTVLRQALWIIYNADVAKQLRGSETLTHIHELNGFKINVGVEGSGGRMLALKLLGLNHLPAPPADEVDLSQAMSESMIDKVEAGHIGASLFVASTDAKVVKTLFKKLASSTPSKIRLLNLVDAEAYTHVIPHLSRAVLPSGIIHLGREIPTTEIALLTSTTSLIVREDLHPALQNILLETSRRVHKKADLFQKEGEFPIGQPSLFHLSDEAERYFRQGNSTPRRPWLPFWVSNMIDRMWLTLMTVAAALIPISRLIPPFYAWRMRRRIFRWYEDLYRIEEAIDGGQVARTELQDNLDKLLARVERTRVPLSRTDELYNLRSHLTLVQQRLEAHQA
jgi:TRAP-type uncharacterized transport system substrate-binding protein